MEGSSETILGLARVPTACSEAPAALTQCMGGSRRTEQLVRVPLLVPPLNRPPLLPATCALLGFSVLGPSEIGYSGRRSDMGEKLFLPTLPIGSCRLCSYPLCLQYALSANALPRAPSSSGTMHSMLGVVGWL